MMDVDGHGRSDRRNADTHLRHSTPLLTASQPRTGPVSRIPCRSYITTSTSNRGSASMWSEQYLGCGPSLYICSKFTMIANTTIGWLADGRSAVVDHSPHHGWWLGQSSPRAHIYIHALALRTVRNTHKCTREPVPGRADGCATRLGGMPEGASTNGR